MLVQDVARTALGAVDNAAGLLLASKWVGERYQQLCGTRRLRHLRRVGELSIPADVADGTATFTLGSRVVIGDATAQAAWLAVAASLRSGRWAIRQNVTWYGVAGLTDAAELRLVSPFAQATVAAAGYRLLLRFHSIDAAARQFTVAYHARLSQPVELISFQELDRMYPTRSTIGAGPTLIAEAPPDADGTRLVEVYPYCDAAEMLGYTYYVNPPTLRLADPIPPGIDPWVLKEGVLVDLFRFAMARAANAVQVEAGALWRNEYRAQETRWAGYMQEAAGMDVGGDDVTILVDRFRGGATADSDIRTAHDEVWSR